MISRIIKYLLNLAGLTWMVIATMAFYGMIVRYPDCDHVMQTIWNNVQDACVIYLLFLVIITTFNFVMERKIEKLSTSRTYLILALLHLSILVICLWYFSAEFYSHCGESS